MMAQSFPPHAGMGPGGGHPGLPHGHPMAGMQHPGAGNMGGPNPGMMQGMHPGVSGPQVTQGQMIAGMPQGPVTSGPGAHAMAHLGPQPPNPMFQQQNPQMAFAQLPQQQQQQAMMRQRQLFHQMQQHQQQQNMAGMMQPQGNQNMTQQHFAQMKAGMNMPNMQQQMQLQAQANAQAQNLNMQNQQHHHQQMMAAQHQQRQMLAQQQHQQRNVSQQMTITRSQEQVSQPPQSIPTPAPQNPAQIQQQPVPPNPAPGAQPKQQPQQSNPQQQPQQNQVGTPQQVNDAAQVKQQDMGTNLNTLDDVPMNEAMGSGLNGQGILRLLMFQDQLCPPAERISDLEYWEEFVRTHFSPFGVLRQQLHNQKTGASKVFQIQFASLARFYHAHFTSGVKEMRMEPIGCTETKLPHGGCNVYSTKTYITYIYDNDIRVITDGWIQCNFDVTNRIEHLSINTKGWTEYIPRGLWPSPDSPDQKQSPKLGKNAKKPQKPQPVLSVAPSSAISDMGVPEYIVRFLEIAEVMMVMGPLMEFSQRNPELRPQEAMYRMVTETAQNMRMNQMVANANGGMQMNTGQRTPGLNGPNQFASPAMNHLVLPQQGSPHIVGPAHTPSPAHLQQGGIAMVHQMSQGNSNLSGSQGPSTNTSPNVTTKRRRASQVKLEDENANQEVNGANKARPSPRTGGKRQKGTA